MAHLKMSGAGGPVYHELTGETLTIGRAAMNTVVLHDIAASSRHAEVVRAGGGWQIRDLGSTNKTFVNGRVVQEAPLASGDFIRIGATEIVFEDGPARALTDSGSTSHSSSGHSASFLKSLVADDDDDDAPDARRANPLARSLLIDDESDSVNAQANWEVLCVDGGSVHHEELKTQLDVDTRRTWMSPAAPSTRRKGESLADAKLRLIQRVSEKLVRIFEPKQLMDEIMSIVIEQTRADCGILCLFDEGRQPVPIASRGLPEGGQVRVSRTVLKRLMEQRAGVLINSSGSSADMFASMQAMRVTSTLCVPLWTGDNISGFLSLDSTSPGKNFSEEDLELLVAVAHQAAIGIERGRLNQLVETERRHRDYLSKYLDNRLVAQITAQAGGADPLAPAEREVTVLFSDIVSFTKFSEGLEPAELAGFISEYLTAMTEIVFNHGGMIDKYVGDAVMALFGAPLPDPDSPLNAIRAAMDMRDRCRDIRLPGGRTTPLRVRFGINTGRAVVGNIGSARRREYTALGDTVNVASRLQTFARPNEVCIDEVTYARAAAAFHVEEIGTVDVKNRAQPVVVYKVLRPK